MPDITLNITTKDLSSDELEQLRRDIKRIKEAVSHQSLAISDQQSVISRQVAAIGDQPSDVSSYASAIIKKMSVPEGFRNLPTVSESQPPIAETLKAISNQPSEINHRTSEVIPLLYDNLTLIRRSGKAKRNPTRNVIETNRIGINTREHFNDSHILKVSENLKAISGQQTAISDQLSVVSSRMPTAEGFRRFPTVENQPPIAENLKAINHQQTAISDQLSVVSSRMPIAEGFQLPITDSLKAVSHQLSVISTRNPLPETYLPIAEGFQPPTADSEKAVSSARKNVAAIEQIERTAAERRKAIESETNDAKIDSFNRVVQHFIRGIGRMITELKLRAADGVPIPQLLEGFLTPMSRKIPILQLLEGFLTPIASPVLSTAATALFSGSFDDPINNTLVQQAGIHQAQQRAVQLGRRSAVDLTQSLSQNVEAGVVHGTERQSVVSPPQEAAPAPVVMNEVKLIIGGQEIKALYEETQRQIATGIIAESR